MISEQAKWSAEGSVPLDARPPVLAIAATHPIQHFCPLFRALTESGRVRPIAFFANDAGQKEYFDAGFGQNVRYQDDLLSGFEYEILPARSRTKSRFSGVGNTALRGKLDSLQPDVVQVYGYYNSIAREALRWARDNGRPVLFCSDSELVSRRPWWITALKALSLPLIFRQYAAFLTVGDSNEAYYRRYGVPSERLHRSPFPIDNSRLEDAFRNRAGARASIRAAYNLPHDAVVALVVGKLLRAKAVDTAIEAVGAAWEKGLEGKLFLIIAGSGPDEERLKDLARAAKPAAIRFAGFVEVADLPRYYSGSDLLLHPSARDRHPLAISEAVYCGLPVIVSDRVGSVGPTDDVRPGVNGFVHPCGSAAALAEMLVRMTADPSVLHTMSAASRDIGLRRTMADSVEGYLSAVQSALASGLRR